MTLCSRCREDTGDVQAVKVRDVPVAVLCRACVRELCAWCTHLPNEEMDWGAIGAIDGEKLIERYELKERLE